jgi:hypothetical protein
MKRQAASLLLQYQYSTITPAANLSQSVQGYGHATCCPQSQKLLMIIHQYSPCSEETPKHTDWVLLAHKP